ncbi:MAG: type II and III secretion system protein family protein [Thermodesulfobacteriota bacterium]|nr:type II and III secretion system protein family protein [Thermodesulfobacteriota bacterium]
MSYRERQSFVNIFALGLLTILLVVHPALAEGSNSAHIVVDTESGKVINLKVDKLCKLRSSSKIKRAHIVNPAIAELVYSKTQSPQWVFLSGKAAGTTQLTLWGDGNQLIGTFEIIVSPDVAGLKKSLHDVFPEENVSVGFSGQFITLTGTVSSSMKLTKILTLAKAFAADGDDKEESKVINLLQVGGIQQVMLEVRIAEISKAVSSRLGINFAWSGSDTFGLSLIDQLTGISEEGFPGGSLLAGNSINAVLGFLGGDPVIVAIDALQEDGLLQILAKPTLIAQSGHSASFLAGGEFPFPIADDFDTVTIEWKPFGVSLSFTPTVLGNDTISLAVSPEVSELDFTKTMSYGGYVVPSIDTRRMSTVVELKDNQSFAIAGLLKNYVRESVKKLPILGDIPILGALFRSTRYQKHETELVVIVTPHLVKPVDADELPLPTDSFEDPSPFEILMLGMLEKGHDPNAVTGNFPGEPGETPVLEGDFGYIVPE